MATVKRFEDLDIWQMARKLAKRVYLLTCQGLFARDFRHRDQLNDSAGSIAYNIAEGFERGGRAEFINFLSFAKGSCGESRSQIYRAFDKSYISEEDHNDLQAEYFELGNKVGKLMDYLNQSEVKGRKFKNRYENSQSQSAPSKQ